MSRKIIKLTDDLRIIGNLDSIKKNILKDLGNNDVVVVAKDEESEIDVAFIQLILAIREKALNDGKKLSTSINFSSSSKKLLNLSGLNYIYTN